MLFFDSPASPAEHVARNGGTITQLGVTGLSTLTRTFLTQSRLYPGKTAVSCDGEGLTFAELSRTVRRWSAGLEKSGVSRGDHVGVVLPNGLHFVTLMLAAADRGAALVPQPESLTPTAIARAFAATDVSHVVASKEILEALSAMDPARFGKKGLLLATDDVPGRGGRGAIGLEEFLNDVDDEPRPALLGEDDDPFILTTTSGSTGNPRPIVLTQRSKLLRAFAAADLYGLSPVDVTLAATPLHHSLAERLVLLPLLTGGTSIVMSRFSPKEWLATVRKYAVTFTIAVSTQLSAVAQSLEDETPIDSLRCVVSSSASMDVSTKIKLAGTLRCDFHECYGASEIGVASNLNLSMAQARTETVGQAVKSVDIQILGEEDRLLPIGQVGEIACRTKTLFGGYYKQPRETATAMWGEYFRTGDLGKLDAEGYLTLVGRKKEIIITGGINVYPADVESVLTELSGIEEAAAFAIPDQQLGEVVGLAIVPKSGQSFDLRRLRQHCARTLADFQQPRKFMIVDRLPRNSMGKLIRCLLLENYLKNGGQHG